MKKNKINVYKLAAKKDHIDSSRENMIEQDNFLELNNTAINNNHK